MDPKIKPLLPSKILIDSHLSLRRLSKNHPLVTHSLELKSYYQIKSCSFRSIMRNTLKKVKFSHKLQMHGFMAYINCKSSYSQKIHKHFQDVKALSIIVLVSRNLQNSSKWMIKSKRLRSLYYKIYNIHQIPIDKSKRQKLLGRLNRTKLENLRLFLGWIDGYHLIPFLLFQGLPSTLKALSLGSNSGPVLMRIKPSYFEGKKAIVSRLTNLKSLEIKASLEMHVIYFLLASLPNPEELLHLTIDTIIGNYTSTDDRENGLSLRDVLRRFSSLKAMSYFVRAPIKTLMHLQFLEVSALKSLDLSLAIKDDNMMIGLGYLLGSLRELESLNIVIQGDIPCVKQDLYSSFFNELSHLTHLRSVQLQIQVNGPKVPGIVSSVAECINKWPWLTKFIFRHTQANVNAEIESLIEALRKKASQLKTLEMSFEKQPLDKTDFKLLLRLLEESKSLQVLKLDGYVFNDKKFTDRLSRILSQSRHLVDLSLKAMIGRIYAEYFEKLAEAILKKKGFESFCLQVIPGSHIEQKRNPWLDVRAILKKNPDLKVLESSIHQLHEDEVTKWKWTRF